METYSTLWQSRPGWAVRRHQAYHEAGHLWTAHLAGIPIGSTNLGSPTPLAYPDPGVEAWACAAGHLTEAMSMRMDQLTDWGLPWTDSVSNLVLQDIVAVMTSDSHCVRRCSERSSVFTCVLTARFPTISVLSTNWAAIDELARLLTRYTVTERDVAEALLREGPRPEPF